MTTHVARRAGIITTIAFAFEALVAGIAAEPAQAADGCGFGMHRGWYGECHVNLPGADATMTPVHPGCWDNGAGHIRCYQGAEEFQPRPVAAVAGVRGGHR